MAVYTSAEAGECLPNSQLHTSLARTPISLFPPCPAIERKTALREKHSVASSRRPFRHDRHIVDVLVTQETISGPAKPASWDRTRKQAQRRWKGVLPSKLGTQLSIE